MKRGLVLLVGLATLTTPRPLLEDAGIRVPPVVAEEHVNPVSLTFAQPEARILYTEAFALSIGKTACYAHGTLDQETGWFPALPYTIRDYAQAYNAFAIRHGMGSDQEVCVDAARAIMARELERQIALGTCDEEPLPPAYTRTTLK